MKNYSRNTFVLVLSLFLAHNQGNAQLFVSLEVSNDMTFFTDRYYSNGVQLEVYGKFAGSIPLQNFLLPHARGNRVYRAFTFLHRMYTPSDTYTPEIDRRDHPYAAYILMGSYKETYDPQARTKVVSGIQLGWMGPLAGGELFQNGIHAVISIAERVQGWQNQVRNDVCLQYSAGIEKGLIYLPGLELNAAIKGRMGSPHTDLAVGTSLRAGIFDPTFDHDGFESDRVIQVWGFVSGNIIVTGYNAALQGGIFNIDNPHTLSAIYPNHWHAAFGGGLIYKRIKIELSQEVISPQFPGMCWHRWANLKLMAGF